MGPSGSGKTTLLHCLAGMADRLSALGAPAATGPTACRPAGRRRRRAGRASGVPGARRGPGAGWSEPAARPAAARPRLCRRLSHVLILGGQDAAIDHARTRIGGAENRTPDSGPRRRRPRRSRSRGGSWDAPT
ncbi:MULTISPECIES: hypothetical protein [Streptomyces]|uniref:Uncharacterized protein n=1 Tax=Streptomyces flavovirens TaxID=52258 RepID=A0ABV8N0K4_9ACTN